MLGGLSVDALGLQRTVVYSFRALVLLELLVLQRSEALPPVLNELGASVEPLVQLPSLLGEALPGKSSSGDEDMGVVVALVSFFAWLVDGDLGGEAVLLHQLPSKGQREVSTLLLGEFSG
jgi:hypothetical protein